MEPILIAIGSLMIAATLIPLVRADHWWIRAFDFPRLQVTIVLLVTFVLYLLVREKPGVFDDVFLGVLSICLIYQAYRMFPYTPLCPKQVQASHEASADGTVRLLICNVYMNNRSAETLRRLVHEEDPDIVLTVETDAWWERELAGLARTHTHVVSQPQDNTYGMLLFSRLKLERAEVKFLVENDVPSIHARVLLRSGRSIELRCLHPRPPAPDESDSSAERDAELLIVAKELKSACAPAIVAGDLNDVAWSRTNGLFQSVSGLLDPRIGRGFFHTFNANWPLIRFPLDHVFSSPHFRLVAFKRLRHCGSDHFPVLIELSWEPDAHARQEEDDATAQEEREAREKIARA